MAQWMLHSPCLQKVCTSRYCDFGANYVFILLWPAALPVYALQALFNMISPEITFRRAPYLRHPHKTRSMAFG